MCGIVGVAGNLQYSDELMMKRLFIFDYFRGTDSTGLAAISPKGEHQIVKRATHPINLFDSKQFEKALDARTNWAFIGHNRAATVGVTNDENAHPFQFGNIIGVHNGTLDKASWRRLEEAAGVQTNVDSAAIFAAIDKIGIDETIKLMEHGKTSQTGAWTLVWYDSSDNTLRMIKNEHRPLYLAVHKKGDRIAWASEWVMLRAAEEMTGGWDTECDENGYSYFSLEDDHLYEFPLEDIAGDFRISDLKKCKGRVIKGREPAPVYTTMGTPPFKTTTTTGTEWRTTKSGGTGNKNEIPNVIHLKSITGDPFGGVVSEKDFEDVSNSGHCSWCGSEVSMYDKSLTVFLEEDVVLCKDCTHRHSEDNKVYISPERMKLYV